MDVIADTPWVVPNTPQLHVGMPASYLNLLDSGLLSDLLFS